MAKNGEIISFFRKKDYIMVDANLGHGSFGKTVLIQDPYIDEVFVAKKYEPEVPSIKEQFFQSFQQEIKILFKLNHRNIVRIFNYYPYEDHYTGYIIMEYIDGNSIDEYFNNYIPWTKDDIGPDDIFKQLISAFQYLEKNSILHRDIRESNILVDKRGTVKVIDFGLGKMYEPIERSDDSMVNVINRTGLDKLPEEVFSGRYNNKTDMFYLAELLNRLMNNSDCKVHFSYQNILDKMMESNPEHRYNSFDEIAKQIDKSDFTLLEISDTDKYIYQTFSNAIFNSLDRYTSKKRFNDSINDFEDNVALVIRENCFEDYVQNESDLIKTVVQCSYRYHNRRQTPVSIIQDFYNWYKPLNSESKQLVLNNIITKLSSIREDIDDIPF